MTKRNGAELDLDIQPVQKKRKLSLDDITDHDINEKHNPLMDNIMLCNGRHSFLRSKRKWIQYRKDINHHKLWMRYSQCMENVYNASFPDLQSLKIGNLITFRKNAQFEFMTGVIIRGPNTNPLSIYTESISRLCIRLLPDSLSTQSINQQLCKINKSKTMHMMNTEQDIYSFIPKQTFNFDYATVSNSSHNMHKTNLQGVSLMLHNKHATNNNNNNTTHTCTESNTKPKIEREKKDHAHKKGRRIVKKEMKFENDVICIDIACYEDVFEHREIVWSQLEGFEWHPSQILFKWKKGERVSPSIAKQQFGLLFILVAFFDVHQTAKIRLTQRYLLPFHDEPNLDILGRTRKDIKKHNTLTAQISNAMILATLQQKINNRLHAQYHSDTHIKNALILKRLSIPKQNWLYQKVLIFDVESKEWKAGRVMYFSEYLQKHFLIYDDDAVVQWLDIDDDVLYTDWCDDTQPDADRLFYNGGTYKRDKTYQRKDSYDHCKSHEKEVHTLSAQTVHDIKEIHGYGVDECSTNKVALSTRFLANDTKNCNKCWICNETAMINVAPICTVNQKSDPIVSIHCICCRRRAHIACLGKAGITREMLKNHLLAVHCDECKACALCKRQLEPQCIVQWIKNVFDVNAFMEQRFVKENEWKKQHMIECNLCRRRFHKKCLPMKCEAEMNRDLWLCFDCRICRCCNERISPNNVWHEGYTLCCTCFAMKDDICNICFKQNSCHEPFWIQCHECKANVHLSCSPFTLDQLFVMQSNNISSYFICYACNGRKMQKIQFNVLRYLINNDNDSRMITKHIHSILMLRTHILSSRITLLHFVKVFREIWNSYDAQIVDQMMDFLCDVVAKYFNHFCATKEKQSPIKLMKCHKNDDEDADDECSNCSYECKYVSNHEVLILNDVCSVCGSSQDALQMILCKRCAISFHSYCVRSSIDYHKTDNIGYCYSCLWYFYDNKISKMAKHVILKQKQQTQNDDKEEESAALWMMEASHLKQLYQLSQSKEEVTHEILAQYCLNHDIPLWIKPLLCDVVNDAKCFTKYKKRITTKRKRDEANTTAVKQDNKNASSLSTLYSTVKYQDGARLKDNRLCSLCHYDAAIDCGRLLPVQQRDANRRRRRECEWIHSKCVLSSTDLDLDYYNTYGSNMLSIDITNILNISSQYKCHLCHKVGASMHCSVTDCTLSYHYPCIVSSQMYDEDWRYHERPFFCNMHKMHFNNNDYTFGDIKIVDMMRNTQNLYDRCVMVLFDRNNMKFVSHSQSHSQSKAKQLFEIKGNTVIKSIKDNDGNVVIYQVYDTFWSYCNIGKRTQFVYESYRHESHDDRHQYLYKLIVNDDPLSTTIFCDSNSNKIFQKLIEKYPQTFEKNLFKAKHCYFL